MGVDLKKYAVIVGYGIGQYYEKSKEELFRLKKPDYLCDRKWECEDAPHTYDGIKIIKRKELAQLKNALVIVFAGTRWIYESVKQDIEQYGIEVVHIGEIVAGIKVLTGKDIKGNGVNGEYTDEKNNRICFDDSLADNVKVLFHGKNNVLKIEKDVVINDLRIYFGNDGMCSIGKNTEVIGAEFMISGASLIIGRDCLFSTSIIVRNHDSHHIFDATTHKRINYPKDIIIEDNVWIGHRVTLLGGAKIGCGSVVGTGAITSGQFQAHTIIAGCPAKVVRENVCWSRDDIDYFNRDYLEECISQEALKYL